MVYVLATIKLRPGKMEDFLTVMKEMLPSVERHGITLVGNYAHEIGRINTIVDLWQAPDHNTIHTMMNDPVFQKWEPRLKDIVEDETMQILVKIPI